MDSSPRALTLVGICTWNSQSSWGMTSDYALRAEILVRAADDDVTEEPHTSEVPRSTGRQPYFAGVRSTAQLQYDEHSMHAMNGTEL